jgi:hypothetical protein
MGAMVERAGHICRPTVRQKIATFINCLVHRGLVRLSHNSGPIPDVGDPSPATKQTYAVRQTAPLFRSPHRRSRAGCNGVALSCVSLFSNPQCVQLRLEGAPIDYFGSSKFISHEVFHHSLRYIAHCCLRHRARHGNSRTATPPSLRHRSCGGRDDGYGLDHISPHTHRPHADIANRRPRDWEIQSPALPVAASSRRAATPPCPNDEIASAHAQPVARRIWLLTQAIKRQIRPGSRVKLCNAEALSSKWQPRSMSIVWGSTGSIAQLPNGGRAKDCPTGRPLFFGIALVYEPVIVAATVLSGLFDVIAIDVDLICLLLFLA